MRYREEEDEEDEEQIDRGEWLRKCQPWVCVEMEELHLYSQDPK